MALSRDAPGMHEAALLERIAETLEQGLADYDLLVFDTAPSGHTARLMALPEMMSAWTEGLLRRQERGSRFSQVLKNSARMIAASASPYSARAMARLRRIATVVSPDLDRRRERFNRLREVLGDAQQCAFVIACRRRAAAGAGNHRTACAAAARRHAGRRAGGEQRSPADAGAFLAERHALEEQHLATLRQALGQLPLLELPCPVTWSAKRRWRPSPAGWSTDPTARHTD